MSRMIPQRLASGPRHWLYPSWSYTHPSFSEHFNPTRRASRPIGWQPSTDVEESDGEFLVSLDVPGVDPKDVEIFVEGNSLVVKGKKENTELEKCSIHCVECCYGPFRKRVDLPADVDAERVEADHDLGVIRVRLPKKAPAKPIKIQLK